ncbi:GrpB family protein [Streptomonospora litoralis]|uniref:Dephospho-CoA kinase/protein folding accessory domain-containing protein n=1 Tax=Streptomonospora litoralis TaxID=2498135 RepID=A0A4P6PX45_9ACTN|nr:GrpB family protein [Streptomonospora litoralis]QBI52250.1 dephospho-CoA kinase/protein folding accessory domain-containing protein [Streptomonospora litoralis]
MSPNEVPDRSPDAARPLPSRRGGGGTEQPTGATAPPPHFIDGRVVIVDADPKWPYLYQREADRIRESLGAAALAVEHVGSTAVADLAAKPCVDVLLTVADPADEDSYLPPLEQAGYAPAHREPDLAGHRVLRGPDVNTNVHVFAPGAAEAERLLLFRDRLRADAAERGLYERTKRRLAQRTWDSIQQYSDAKSEVVEQILARARETQPAAAE